MMLKGIAKMFKGKPKLFAIDPSLHNAGWCMFDLDTKKKTAAYRKSGVQHTSEYIDEIEVLNAPGKAPHDANLYVARIDEMVTELERIIVQSIGAYDIVTVLIELPWGAQAFNQADIEKLVALVYSLRTSFYMQEQILDVYLVPVHVWKGQLKKEITQRRINKRWGLDIDQLDESDAIGIASYFIEEHLCYKPKVKK